MNVLKTVSVFIIVFHNGSFIITNVNIITTIVNTAIKEKRLFLSDAFEEKRYLKISRIARIGGTVTKPYISIEKIDLIKEKIAGFHSEYVSRHQSLLKLVFIAGTNSDKSGRLMNRYKDQSRQSIRIFFAFFLMRDRNKK